MRVHYIQHVPFEGLGCIGSWLQKKGHITTATRVWKEKIFPPIENFDALIVMGGPMGVYDDRLYPWLTTEKEFILDCIKSGKAVIGICLGAQLVASVLGAKVYPNQHKEIGWYPIDIQPAFSEWQEADTPGRLTVFHWHGDKFDIPEGGTNHAASEACNHQLFTFGERIIGIQFHLEATPETVKAMIDNENGELQKAPYIQHKNTILANSEHFTVANKMMGDILDRVLASEKIFYQSK